LAAGSKTLCLATAHPCKFPDSIQTTLGLTKNALPAAAKHSSVEKAKLLCQRGYHCNYENMETGIRHSMLAKLQG